jgi:hypothetical protein
MRKITTTFLAICLLLNFCRSQGCVAAKNLPGFGQFSQLGYGQSSDKWLVDIDNRYFSAYTFLQGSQNITPTERITGVTLYEYTLNFGLTRVLKNGWSINIDLPISSNATYGELEHASGDAHTTNSFGLGDTRFTVYKWLLKDDVSRRGNIQFGLGLKFPTGNYHSEDYFYEDPNNKAATTLAPVNVAIQLGDGGTGIITQLNAYYFFNPHINVYGNFFYLISPKDQNGVAAWPPGLLPDATLALFHQATYDVNSVPDNYTLRAGANILFGDFVGTAGLRYEGAPAHDLIGKDDGLRRVGHIFSAEPGIHYKLKKSFIYTFVTIPIARRTILTVPDERLAALTGTPATITPGHFANSLFYVGYAFTF